MKKYYNKALIFYWFNSAKIVIFLGMLLWGAAAEIMLNRRMNNVIGDIAYNFDNCFSIMGDGYYIFLAFIFIAIFYISMGINKKNNMMFLSSGPYTKKQIKINEIICMIITLVLYLIEHLYLIIMCSVKYNELLGIVNGYWYIYAIEILKIFLFGIGGILILNILDMLFVNSVVAMVSMVSLFPLSLLMILNQIGRIIEYIPKKVVDDVIDYSLNKVWISKYPLFESYISINNIDIKYLFKDIFLTLFIVAVIFIVFIIMENKNRIEFSTRIFSSKKSENFIVALGSLTAGIIINLFIMDSFIRNYSGVQMNNGMLYGKSLVMVLGIEGITIIAAAVVCFVLLKKMIKKIS